MSKTPDLLYGCDAFSASIRKAKPVPTWGELQTGKGTCGLVSALRTVRLDRQHNQTLDAANRP